MKYQLRYLLHQLEHQKSLQIQNQGQVEEWLFPLMKAARQALEVLELGAQAPQAPQEQGLQQEAQDEERVQVLESALRELGLVLGQELALAKGKVLELESELAKAQLKVSDLEMALDYQRAQAMGKE